MSVGASDEHKGKQEKCRNPGCTKIRVILNHPFWELHLTKNGKKFLILLLESVQLGIFLPVLLLWGVFFFFLPTSHHVNHVFWPQQGVPSWRSLILNKSHTIQINHTSTKQSDANTVYISTCNLGLPPRSMTTGSTWPFSTYCSYCHVCW